mgnify:CR=1 FL=1
MTASVHDFDFFHGDWRVQHRRLRARLAGCDDWDTFDGTSRVRPLLGGAGNVDDNALDLPGGAYRAVTLRSCDPATGLWSIWWLDGRWPHRLDVPMVGRFVGFAYMLNGVTRGSTVAIAGAPGSASLPLRRAAKPTRSRGSA